MGAWNGGLDKWYEYPSNKEDSGDKGGDDDEPNGKRSQVIVGSTSKAKEGTGLKSWDTKTICPYHWSKPIAMMNCGFVWLSALDYPNGIHSYPHPNRLVF